MDLRCYSSSNHGARDLCLRFLFKRFASLMPSKSQLNDHPLKHGPQEHICLPSKQTWVIFVTQHQHRRWVGISYSKSYITRSHMLHVSTIWPSKDRAFRGSLPCHARIVVAATKSTINLRKFRKETQPTIFPEGFFGISSINSTPPASHLYCTLASDTC